MKNKEIVFLVIAMILLGFIFGFISGTTYTLKQGLKLARAMGFSAVWNVTDVELIQLYVKYGGRITKNPIYNKLNLTQLNISESGS
jgi:hypothetical protein